MYHFHGGKMENKKVNRLYWLILVRYKINGGLSWPGLADIYVQGDTLKEEDSPTEWAAPSSNDPDTTKRNQGCCPRSSLLHVVRAVTAAAAILHGPSNPISLAF